MKQEGYVISGVNRLTGYREELSGPMSRDRAERRLEREKTNRKYQRYQTHMRLRVEKRLPTQLALQFEEYE